MDRGETSQLAPILEYGGYVQKEWVRGVLNIWLTEKGRCGILLSGDAGCGKSKTLRDLIAQMDALGFYGCYYVTATTHKAAGIQRELGAVTYHSALGMNLDLCRASMNEFGPLYEKMFGAAINRWQHISERSVEIACKDDHGCADLSMRCSKCLTIIRKLMASVNRQPPITSTGMIVIDEYGIISENSLKKILFCLSKFSLPGQGHMIIFTGSVSQLPSPDKPELWSGNFKSIINHQYTLFINFRVEDRDYSEAVNLMQFNVTTLAAKNIFDSRVIGAIARDPEHDTDVTRIFNGNHERDIYNTAYGEMMSMKGCEIVESKPSFVCTAGSKAISFGEILDYMCISCPKIFNKATKGVHTFYIPGFVFVLPKQDKQRLVAIDQKKGAAYLEMSCATESVITKTILNHGGWTVTYWPFFPVASINTYSAQGETLKEAIYVPPEKFYARSPIKASAYVACSRVRNRNSIQLSCNSFANRVGNTDLFPRGLLLYKKEMEMGYVRK